MPVSRSRPLCHYRAPHRFRERFLRQYTRPALQSVTTWPHPQHWRVFKQARQFCSPRIQAWLKSQRISKGLQQVKHCVHDISKQGNRTAACQASSFLFVLPPYTRNNVFAFMFVIRIRNHEIQARKNRMRSHSIVIAQIYL
jgi:hypothetical protein